MPKLHILPRRFTAAIAKALKAAAENRRSVLPILQHILVCASPERITLRATDMELAFEVVLPAEGSAEWAACVMGSDFIACAKKLAKTGFSIEPGEGSLLLTGTDGASELTSVSAEGFPELPAPAKELPVVRIPVLRFKRAIQLGSIAVSKDTTKPTLSAVLVHLSKHHVRVVSTDGFRLAVAEVPCDTKLKDEVRLIVPKRALDLIPTLLGDEGEVELCWDGTTLYLDQPGLKFSTRLVTGNYPAYEKVLPAELPKKVILDREVFLRTLRFVGLKKDDYNKNVRLFYEFPNLRTVFQHPDEGVNQATLPFTGEEQPFELAFNIDYLTELLERLPGEEVVYQFKDEVGQGVFMSPSLEDFSFRYVLMPVRFANSATA